MEQIFHYTILEIHYPAVQTLKNLIKLKVAATIGSFNPNKSIDDQLTISSIISFTESIPETNPEISPAGRTPESISPSIHDFITD